ncbi:hypothetical protein ACHQM5_009350 [Ranunculus cassubicifolius]
MEMSTWLSEMGMEDSTFFNQYQMDFSDDLTPEQLAAAYGQDIQQPNSSNSFSSYPDFNPSPLYLDEAIQTFSERPTKQLKTSTDSCNSCTTEPTYMPEGSSSPIMLYFGNSDPLPTSQQQFHEEVISSTKKSAAYLSQNYAPKSGQGNKRACVTKTKEPSIAQKDHIVAERKRREKLSRLFIAFSALVPGLKKMDKSSVLEDGIKYIKQLQERVKTLEEQTANTTMDSVVYVKKFQIISDDDGEISHEPLPEIQARVLEKNVLIRIHCENRKGVQGKLLEEIQKLNLSVVHSSITPFGTSTLDITVMTEMGVGYGMTVVDLVKQLHSTFRKFMLK